MTQQSTSRASSRPPLVVEPLPHFRGLLLRLSRAALRIRRGEPVPGTVIHRPSSAMGSRRSKWIPLALLIGTGLAAAGADVIVTTQADEDNGSLDPGLGSGTSLREAVLHAGAGSTIGFAAVLDGQTVTLGLGQIVIAKNLAINASALPSGIRVSGNDSSRVFDISSGRTVTMNRLKIIDGAIATVGGGIRNAGSLTLSDCELSSNRADDGGGAIRNSGTLALNACTVDGNTAGVGGGAIEHASGLLTLTNCTMTGNSAQWGGAIDGDGSSTIRLYSCTLAGNHASDKGGGIEETTGTLVLENSIVAGNTATNSGPDLKASSINSQLGVNLLSSTNGLGGSYSGIVGTADLMPLNDYGGATRTLLPLPGSPARNAGGATALTVDQRGLPRVVGAAVDIGAVEVQPPLVVTTDLNFGPGSLRHTVGIAPSGSTITFHPLLDGASIDVYPTTIGEDFEVSNPIVLDKCLIIDASEREDLEVVGRVLPAYHTPTELLQLPHETSVAIYNLRFTGAGGPGSAIQNEGDLLMDHCQLVGNYSTSGDGGAITNGDTANLKLTRCLLSGNLAYGGPGGAIYNVGSAVLDHTTIAGNRSTGWWNFGGGIANCGKLEMTDSVLTGNTSEDGGGGGLYSYGTLAMTRCTVEGNDSYGSGSGLYLENGGSLSACTISGNRGEDCEGAGIFQLGGGLLTLVQCTISDNHAGLGSGGGIASHGALTAASCTIAGNSAEIEGGGISLVAPAALTLSNSIVAGNSAPLGADIRGAIAVQQGVSLVTATDGILGPFTGIVDDPVLGPLADNGGPTLTMLPLPGSPAIDAGGATSLFVDQRGFTRVIGGTVDIGSAEVGFVTPGLVVNTTSDENDGPGVGDISLRDAITGAAPGSVVSFAPSLSGQVLTLSLGQLTLTKNLTIDASGLPEGITVSGAASFRVFEVQSGKTVGMTGLRIVNGRVSADGGGIRNAGNLTLDRCEVASNLAGDDGGGIFNTGTLTLTSTQLGANTANDSGGAIASEGLLSLSFCSLSGNVADNGGGIYNDDGVLTIDESTLRDNVAGDTPGGGAVDNDNGGEVSITRSTLSGNRSVSGGGAIENDGKLTILACTLSGNTAAVGGGAIEHAAGVLGLTSSTLAGNTAKYGGAIDGDGTSTIRLNCCTVANNHASDKGGGIEETTGTLVLENSIIGSNRATNSGPDLKVSSINSELGVNLVSSTNGLGGTFHGIVALPALSSLANWGGPTETMPPLSGSPAMDAGGPTTLNVDQRGFPRLDGRWIDIGAVEVPFYLLVTSTNDSGEGSLRRSIELARPGSLIPISPYLGWRIISLTSEPLVIAKDLDFDASGWWGGVIVKGEVTRAFDIKAGVRVTMKGINVSGFYSPWDDGAAIRNAGHLELTGCSLTGNTAMNGGAIFSAEGAVLALTDCDLRSNVGVFAGGAIYSEGTATLTRTVVYLNRTGVDDGFGGGIWSGGDLTVVDSDIIYNHARVAGGIDSNGSLTMLRSAVEENEAWDGDAGGIGVGGTGGSIADTTIAGNFCLGLGGGIDHVSGTLDVTNCTIEGNSISADFGGGIFSEADLRVESCTIARNRGAWEGGGIYVDDDGWYSDGYLTLGNSIVAGNESAEDGPDIHGPIEAEFGVNLLGSTEGVTTPFAGIVADPMLSPLGNYGGPTMTMLPLPGSPAIDAGGATALTLDQRGFTRVVGAKVDIGSVETGNVIPP